MFSNWCAPRQTHPSHRALRDTDSGLGMITVIGVSSVLIVVVAISVSVAVFSLGSSRDHLNYEAALTAAETGLNSTLGEIQAANDTGGVIVQDPDCAPWWPAQFNPANPPGPAEESAWVKSAIDDMAEECFDSGGQGTYVSWRASDVNGVPLPFIYAAGWSPNRENQRNASRLVKVEYMFSPYRPSEAVLSQGSIEISGSVNITMQDPDNPDTADIHSNSAINISNNSLQVQGQITTSAGFTGNSCPSGVEYGCEAAVAPISVPLVSARTVYRNLAKSTSASWFDLCVDRSVSPPVGVVKTPNVTTFEPCTGTTELSRNDTFRGWTFDGNDNNKYWDDEWNFVPAYGTDYPGTYYVYQASAILGGPGRVADNATISVLAEAAPTTDSSTPLATCNKAGGNIEWKGVRISNYLPGTLFIADGSIRGTANTDVGSGLIAAGDRIYMKTSSATVTGALVASNTCTAAGANELQGLSLVFANSSEVPISSIVRTTSWVELGGL